MCYGLTDDDAPCYAQVAIARFDYRDAACCKSAIHKTMHNVYCIIFKYMIA